jgi:xanthine dehydrogenase accessory factor
MSEHGDPGHVHDEACEIAHGDRSAPHQGRRLVVVFASPVAQELAVLAERVGWSVVLLDPGAGPASGGVTTVAAAGLDDGTDVVVCDHDRPELGDVLAAVLAEPVRWVGVMGSPRHTAPHVAALRERGLSEDDIARVHRPIGLDIGSKAPAEIAVSTLAGLIAHRNGRSGGFFG